MSRQVKPLTFRLRPEGRSLYCRVNVWPDQASMLAYLRRSRNQAFAHHHSNATALCCGRHIFRVLPDGRMRRSGEFAEINCHRERLDSEIVVHETTHAALRWADRIGLAMDRYNSGFDASDEEERFCYGLGVMVAQFSNALHRRKAW